LNRAAVKNIDEPECWQAVQLVDMQATRQEFKTLDLLICGKRRRLSLNCQLCSIPEDH